MTIYGGAKDADRVDLALEPGPNNERYVWVRMEDKMWDCWKGAPGFNNYERRESLDARTIQEICELMQALRGRHYEGT